jgi:hypothetical protein
MWFLLCLLAGVVYGDTRVILQNEVSLLAYDLSFEPNFFDFSFKGQVHITFSTVASTNTVKLNAEGLVLISASIRNELSGTFNSNSN